MNTFERKYAAAMTELQATEMWPSNYDPPINRLYRKFGTQVRPPHYVQFWRALLGQGVFFGIFWGVLMWVFEWRGSGMPIAGMVSSVLLAGAIFGATMAGMYAHGRKKWKLTAWDDL